jgi:LCP family protein required for cell wall assembly
VAALLSFLWPGLGQFYSGRRRLGVVFALPALLALLLVVWQLREGVAVFGTRLAVDQAYSTPAVVLILAAGAWRVASVIHAFLASAPPATRRAAQQAVVAALVLIIAVSHTAVGYSVWWTNDQLAPGFNAGNTDLIEQATAPPTLGPGATPSPKPTLTPSPSPVPITSRVTILFTGVDADVSRQEHLYDSIMVVSYDPVTNSVQMVSVPRDSASFPLYFGGQVSVTTRINSLPTYVRNGWVRSPDPPYTTLVKEVGYLVGIPINYYAVMSLDGFVKMIDMVGGIDVDNPSLIDDPVYATPGGQIIGFKLQPGPQHLNGNQALAYVRSRHGADNSDWARSGRQQQVLIALLHKMADPGALLQLPSLISELGKSISTTFPANMVADYVRIGQNIPSANFQGVVLGPPYTILNVNKTNSASTTCLLNYKVAQLSVQLFGQDSTWYGKPLPANTCPL